MKIMKSCKLELQQRYTNLLIRHELRNIVDLGRSRESDDVIFRYALVIFEVLSNKSQVLRRVILQVNQHGRMDQLYREGSKGFAFHNVGIVRGAEIVPAGEKREAPSGFSISAL